MRRLLRRVGSPRLAAVLIAMLMLLSVVNVLLPQKTYLSPAEFEAFRASAPAAASLMESLGLDSIFTGWLMAAVTAVLCANVAACTWLRIAARRAGSGRVPMRSESAAVTASAFDERATLATVVERLSAQGWRVAEDARGIRASKGLGGGFWGSVALHLSIIVIAIGGVLVTLTSFTGTLVLAEGQSLVDERAAYLTVTREPRLQPAFTGAQVSVRDVRVAYDAGRIVAVEADMSAIDRRGVAVEREVSVNHPLDVAGKSFLLQDTGLAAEVEIAGESGTENVVLNLAQRSPRGFTDTFRLPAEDGAVPVVMTLTPVPLAAKASGPAEVLNTTEPRLELRVGVDANGRTPDAVLAPGESAQVAPGTTLRFRDVRYWNRFLVRSEPARILVYAGFALAVAGAFWRFVSSERRIAFRLQDIGGERCVRVSYSSRPWGLSHSADRDLARDLLRTAAGRNET